MYKLNISKKVQKFILKRNKSEKAKIISVFEILKEDPFDSQIDIKPFISKTKDN